MDNGREVFAMAMLTVNADDHQLINRFHAHGDEKRMVVILDPKDYSDWLACPIPEANRYFKQWRGPLEAHPAPFLRRAPKTSSAATSAVKLAKPLTPKVNKPAPPAAPQNGELF